MYSSLFTASITVTPTQQTPPPHNKETKYYSEFVDTIHATIESVYDDAVHSITSEGNLTLIDHNCANLIKTQQDTCVAQMKRLGKMENQHHTLIYC